MLSFELKKMQNRLSQYGEKSRLSGRPHEGKMVMQELVLVWTLAMVGIAAWVGLMAWRSGRLAAKLNCDRPRASIGCTLNDSDKELIQLRAEVARLTAEGLYAESLIRRLLAEQKGDHGAENSANDRGHTQHPH